MPACGEIPKPAGASQTTVVVAALYIFIVTIPCLLILTAVVRNPFKNLRGGFCLLIASLSCACFFTAPVNAMRCWVHQRNATGINVHITRKDLIPALLACKIHWIASHCAGAMSLLAIVIQQRIATSSEYNFSFSSGYGNKFTVLLIWISSFGIGLLDLVIGFSRLFLATTIFECIVALLGLPLACLHVKSLTNQDQGKTTATNNLPEEKENDGKSSINEYPKVVDHAGITPVSLPVVRADKVEDSSKEINAIALDDARSTFYLMILFFSAIISSGIMVLIETYMDSLTCSQMYWLKDISKNIGQGFLAFTPALLIATIPRIKEAIKAMFTSGKSRTHPV